MMGRIDKVLPIVVWRIRRSFTAFPNRTTQAWLFAGDQHVNMLMRLELLIPSVQVTVITDPIGVDILDPEVGRFGEPMDANSRSPGWDGRSVGG